jgi:MoxR-like ATPase
MKLACALAAVNGRDFVIPDDIKSLAEPALSHRLILGADPWVRGVRPASIIESVLRQVPVPKVG